MSEYWPFLLAVVGLTVAFGLYIGAWYAFFATIRLLRRLPSWTVVGWLARHYKYRNQLTIFRLSWVLPFYSRLRPRVLLLMTDNGPTSVAFEWFKGYRRNVTNKTSSANTPGGGSIRWGKGEKEYAGDVAKLPTIRWAKTGEFADEVEDEHGKFPIHAAKWNRYDLRKHRRPGKERSWIYYVDGTNAHFRSLTDMLKALGWEPVVNQKKHQATPQPQYDEWEMA